MPISDFAITVDVGMWLDMVSDTQNIVHLAFQDATGDRLMYATFSNGSILSDPDIIDDGVRPGDNRSHPVGASASILVDGDRLPTIVYQDGLTSDVEMYRIDQGSWRRTSIKTGDRLDGFFIASTRDGDTMWLSHYFYDRTAIPPGELEFVTLP